MKNRVTGDLKNQRDTKQIFIKKCKNLSPPG